MQKNPANFIPLTPISFLHRTADIYGERTAIIYEDCSLSWKSCRDRCVRIASSLNNLGIHQGDTVAVFAFNTPEMFESHFSVPMSGGVLNTINTRLDAATIAYILDDGDAKALIVDRELLDVASAALSLANNKPKVVLIDDKYASIKQKIELDVIEYESHHKMASHNMDG